MEAYEINVLASAVLRNLEQIEDPEKSRLTCQLWSDVRKPDRFDRVHLNLTFLHAISSAHLYVRTYPDSDCAGDLSTANALAKPLSKHHVENLLQCGFAEPKHQEHREVSLQNAVKTRFCLLDTMAQRCLLHRKGATPQSALPSDIYSLFCVDQSL
jgi:hypothetical protein